jgi:hypothetical protein
VKNNEKYRVTFVRKQSNAKRKSRPYSITVDGDNAKINAFYPNGFTTVDAYSLPYKLYGSQVERILSVIPVGYSK